MMDQSPITLWDVLILGTCVIGVTIVITCVIIARRKSKVFYTRVDIDENAPKEESKENVFDSDDEDEEGNIKLEDMNEENIQLEDSKEDIFDSNDITIENQDEI